MNDMGERVAAAAASVVIVAMMISIVVWLAILALGGGLILKGLLALWRRSQGQAGPSSNRAKGGRMVAPPRWFDAPPQAQWLAAYDHWIYRLENVTGIRFSTTPEGIMTAAILITLGPALLIGLPLAALYPAYSGPGLAVLLGLAVVIGGMTGNKLAQPAAGWFGTVPQGGGGAAPEEPGFVLGEEDW